MLNKYWLKKFILVVNIFIIGGMAISSTSSFIPITGQNPPAIRTEGYLSNIPPFQSFVDSVVNGALDVRGLYIPAVLALEVVQQPKSQPAFVSTDPDVATQFGLASSYGTIGLLAHNFAGGTDFDEIVTGDQIELVYGDGHIKEYQVSSILRFQAINPTNTKTSFLDLSTKTKVSAQELFLRAYGGEPHLTLQTCIAKGTVSSWGRLFIIAGPVQ